MIHTRKYMPDTKQSICLNMIVKDESHVIEKTLKNLCDNIPFSYWVISDTGSSDNTIELIGRNRGIGDHFSELLKFVHEYKPRGVLPI